MNKVICAICGTAFPENAPKCPICGYVQTNESAVVAAPSYSHVKGGRFSKSNVKKRNKGKTAAAEKTAPAARRTSTQKKKTKSNVGTLIVIGLLLLAILFVIGYIALRFLIPNGFMYEGLGGLNPFGPSQETQEPALNENETPEPDATENSEPSLECTAVQLDKNDIQLDGVGATYKLAVSLEPADTIDQVAYSSSDEAVVYVSQDGTITAVGEGSAVITVTCGNVSAECFVICTVDEPIKFTLNRKEITFKTEGESWLLYDGEISHEEIIWSSDDNNVATIEDGKVIAVGTGETTVQGFYNGQSASCLIRCEFEENTEDESGSVSEATGEEEDEENKENTEVEDDGKTYELFNPYGFAEDVTIRPGEKFTLKLVDDKKNEVTDAQWSVDNPEVCTFDDNTVTGARSGRRTKVTATYKGKTYTCIVRVI